MTDKNKDGYLDKKEFSKISKNIPREQMDKVFDKMDKNQDGKLDKNELTLVDGGAKKKPSPVWLVCKRM